MESVPKRPLVTFSVRFSCVFGVVRCSAAQGGEVGRSAHPQNEGDRAGIGAETPFGDVFGAILLRFRWGVVRWGAAGWAGVWCGAVGCSGCAGAARVQYSAARVRCGAGGRIAAGPRDRLASAGAAAYRRGSRPMRSYTFASIGRASSSARSAFTARMRSSSAGSSSSSSARARMGPNVSTTASATPFFRSP